MSEALKKELSKKAGLLLNTIDRGVVNLNEIKNFLVSVEKLSSPRRKTKSRILEEQVNAFLK
jgi:hypothetical protein